MEVEVYTYVRGNPRLVGYLKVEENENIKYIPSQDAVQFIKENLEEIDLLDMINEMNKQIDETKREYEHMSKNYPDKFEILRPYQDRLKTYENIYRKLTNEWNEKYET
jgi:hypothetical protein